MWPSSPISQSPHTPNYNHTTIYHCLHHNSCSYRTGQIYNFMAYDPRQLPNTIDDIKFVSSIRSISKSKLKPQKMQHDLKKKNRARNKEDCKIKGYLSVQTSDVINNQISHPRLIFQDHMH